MVLLNKISLENFLAQEVLYSKLVRGNLPFKVEVHTLDNGKKLQIYFYRDHDQIDDFIRAGYAKEVLNDQNFKTEVDTGVFRLIINEEKFMINGGGKATIKVRDINFTKKGIEIKDFPKGKIAILIDIDFEKDIDNSKFKKEMKDYFTEVQDGKQ